MKEYKRLTEIKNGIVYSAKKTKSNYISAIYEEQKKIDYEIYTRLAELEDKIENGTLVELSFKPNDKVYYINDYGKDVKGNHVYEVEEGYISTIWLWASGNRSYEVVKESGSIDTEEGKLLDNGFYLTKADAEAKLLELKGATK